MDNFRQNELISLGDIGIAIGLASILLLLTFILLKRLKPEILNQFSKITQLKSIQLIERTHISKLGDVYLLSVKNENFVVVKSGQSISICRMNNNQNESNNQDGTSPQC